MPGVVRITDDSTTPAANGPGTADRDSSLRAVPAAFYGRTAHAAGTGDSQADRYRQLALCRAVAAACGAWVTAEFFDEDCRAGYPWPDRPQGRFLLAALAGPGRPAGAVVVADPWRLLPRRPAPGGAGILALLAFRRVQPAAGLPRSARECGWGEYPGTLATGVQGSPGAGQ